MISPTLITSTVFYSLAGIIAGLMAGVVGIGGGVIIVPALLIIFQHIIELPPDLAMHLASGTSLAIIILISQATVFAHYWRDNILWAVYRRLVLGILTGTVIGALLASYLPAFWLKKILAVFLLFIVGKMVFNVKATKPIIPRQPSAWINGLISFLIGLSSGLLGIGGGAFIVPYLSYCGIEMRKIIPISALCIMTAAIVGTCIFIAMGLNQPKLPLYATGYVYWPAVLSIAIPSVLAAFVGVRLTYVLSQKQLEYIFIIILLITSIHLLLR